jgi:hypothetical protein
MLQRFFKIRGNFSMEMTIEETLKLRAERRKKLKNSITSFIMFLKLMSKRACPKKD